MTHTKHLDLGCGPRPRNPYNCDKLYGIDIRNSLDQNIYNVNLNCEQIPFENDFFNSVSAYDFLEHVPRVVVDINQKKTIFVFIDLMNEIHRVLKMGGRFYASTPVVPHLAAFVDPTHVNYLTSKTHEYFTGQNPLARMYGFSGNFELIRALRHRPRLDYEPINPNFNYWFKQKKDMLKNRQSHILWEFTKN